MEKYTSSTSETEHLEPEILAAFLDGQLSEMENGRVRRHLAECEDCNDVFVWTVEFLREEEKRAKTGDGEEIEKDGVGDSEVKARVGEPDNVLPFGKPNFTRKDDPPPVQVPSREWGWRAAVAATVLLAVGAGFLGYRALEAPGVAGSGLPIEAPANPDMNRSGSSELLDPEAAFTLGAQTRALKALVDANRQEEATSRLVDEMTDVVMRTRSLRDLKLDRTTPNRADRLLAADLRGKLDSPQWFDLGAFAAEGKAAAKAEKEEALRGSWDGFRFGRQLSLLRREKAGPLNEDVQTHLERIEDLRDDEVLDFMALGKEFDALLDTPWQEKPRAS